MTLLNFIADNDLIFLDGAMGTELIRRGSTVPGGLNNIVNPDIVKSIHEDYINAGSQIISANTFSVNSIYAETHFPDHDYKLINSEGVRLAKEAAGDKAFVVGDLGPTGGMLEPFGQYSEKDFYDAFKEQAQILLDAGVDGFIIETQYDLREALAAVDAISDICDLPILVSFTITSKEKGAFTMMGNNITQCHRELKNKNVTSFGVNCGEVDPFEVAELVGYIKGFSQMHISACPNAGKPKLVDCATVYDMTPDDFAKGLVAIRDAGAKFIGGCCGTSPEHIKVAYDLIIK